jgi:hypothetical protein
MVSARSTLIIKSGPNLFSCLLSGDSPSPIHIFALLTQPLSGTCQTINTLIAKRRPVSITDAKEFSPSASASAESNFAQHHVFAADVTVLVPKVADSPDRDAGSLAAAAAMPSQVCLKYAAGTEKVAELRREGMLYTHELATLADIAVPRTYGFYTGGTADAPVACLVMDLCVSTEMLRSANEFWCVFPPPKALPLGQL